MDCANTGLMSMSRAVGNGRRYQAAVWQLVRMFPGGMVKSLLYNMPTSCLACLNLATLMWCADDRARIRTSSGPPTKKQLEDFGISEDMFKTIQKELQGACLPKNRAGAGGKH